MPTSAPKSLALRGALLLGSIAIAAAAFIHAGSEAELLSIGPGASKRLGLDSHIEGALVERSFRTELAGSQVQAEGGFPRLSAPLIALAKDSFAADPLEVSSLRTVALGSLLHEDEERARRVMRLASRISKRDSVTNLWLAQDYGRAGDLESMIAAFDHTLRTSTRAREFAMKPVVDALASKESHVPLGKLLATRPEWENDFWQELVRNPVGVANAVSFLRDSGTPADRIPAPVRAVFYDKLKKTQDYSTLFDFAQLDPRAREGGAELAAGKIKAVGDGTPLGWTLRSQGSFSAGVNNNTGDLQIDARSGSFGVAASRIVRGGGGGRVVVIRMAEPVPDNAEVELTVQCASTNRKLTSILLGPGQSSGSASFSADGCEFVGLELSFAIKPGRRDAFLRIAAVTLQGVGA